MSEMLSDPLFISFIQTIIPLGILILALAVGAMVVGLVLKAAVVFCFKMVRPRFKKGN